MKLLSAKEVADLLGVTTGTLAKWRTARKGPQGYVYLSSNNVAYPEAKVKEFIEGLSGHNDEWHEQHPNQGAA